jgi:hypothetical protein
MTNTVTGIFNKPDQAKEAFVELEEHGFNKERISVLMSDQTKGKAFTIEKGNKAGEGAAIGASLTGLAAAIAAGLAAVGSLTIPGLSLVAVGPIVAALTGAGIGAAAGGLIGSLIGLGIPEYEAKLYEKKIKEGGVLIAVETRNSDEERTVKDIFQANEAKNIAA